MVGKKGRSGRRKMAESNPSGPGFPPLDQLEPPEWLDETGIAKWFELVPILTKVDGLLSNSDRDSIAMYCDAFSRMRAVTEAIGDNWAIKSLAGGQYPHPLVSVRNRAVDEMKVYGRELGLTPAARASLRIGSGQSNTDPEAVRFNRALRHRAT